MVRHRRKSLIRRTRDFLAELTYRFRIFSQNVGGAVESRFRKAFGGVLAAADRVDQVGTGAASGLSATLTTPLRWIGKLLVRGVQLLMPPFLRAWAAKAWQGMLRGQRQVGKGLMTLAQKLNLDGPILKLVRWTRPLWQALATVVGFTQAWLATRHWKRMAWGLPAAAMLLPLALVGGRSALIGNAGVAAQYKQAVKDALSDDDDNRVQLYERKLAQLGVDTQLTDYRTALALAANNKWEEAYQRMRRLAPLDDRGYPSAHYWLVQNLLAGNLDDIVDIRESGSLAPGATRGQSAVGQSAVGQSAAVESAAVAQAGAHLDQLERQGVSDFGVVFLRAAWHAARQEMDAAIELLAPFEEIEPAAAMERMRLMLFQHRADLAAATARVVDKQMANRQRRGEAISARDHQWWATAAELIGDRRRMTESLEAWRALEPGNLAARRSLALLASREFAMELQQPQPRGERLGRLLQEWEADASDPRPKVAAAQLYQRRESSPGYAEAIAYLAESPDTSAAVLEVLGTGALMEKRWEESEQLLRKALAIHAENSRALNNLAWLMMQRPSPDVAEAIVLVDLAIALNPDDYHFRETRGQILMKLERWEEAVAELEVALNGLPDSTAVHRGLALAYSRLGMSDLAAVHAERGEGAIP